MVGKILESLYSIGNEWSRRSPNVDVANDLRGQLTSWLERIPDHLKLSDYNAMVRAPPNVLALHTEYWCAAILLYRPL